MRAFLAVLLLAAIAPTAAAQSGAATDDPELESRARALEGRIRAPCCWNQTLDIHSSEISQELRHEIRQRMRAGDTADEIQADFVARYGERILAVPPGNPLGTFATALLVVGLLAGGGVFYMGFRWRKRGRTADAASKAAAKSDETKSASGEKAPGDAERDALDERLDAELRDA